MKNEKGISLCQLRRGFVVTGGFVLDSLPFVPISHPIEDMVDLHQVC